MKLPFKRQKPLPVRIRLAAAVLAGTGLMMRRRGV